MVMPTSARPVHTANAMDAGIFAIAFANMITFATPNPMYPPMATKIKALFDLCINANEESSSHES